MQHPSRKQKPPPARVLVRPLLRWFRRNARDLPWRRDRSPYGVWVSEIMLQQTQVKTVLPYWQRWMRALPDIRSLARARPERVLKLWEGLGYYSRARNLQAAARLLAARPGGGFPEDFAAILALPGVGRYTAGAICSIAFNQPAPILDGNVVRVLTRIHGVRKDPRERRTNERLWRLASELVLAAAEVQRAGERNCSDLNEALMELGALVCTPQQPRCSECPVRDSCVALEQQRVDRIPRRARRPASTRQRFAAFVVEIDGRFVVRQRPAGVVNAGLWEFPNVQVTGDGVSLEAAFASVLGPGRMTGPPVLRVQHSITRFRIVLDVYRITTDRLRGGRDERKKLLSLPQLQRLAFSSAHRKILGHLRTQGNTDASPRSGSARRRKQA